MKPDNNLTMRYLIIIIITLLLGFKLLGQSMSSSETPLSLKDVIQMAQQQSIEARRAATLKTTRYWEWRSFKSNYKPRIELSGTLPGFTRSFQEVTQPDGSVDFLSVSNNNAAIDLSMQQGLALTGGTLFVGTTLQRFDDFKRDFTLYSGSPVLIGFSQPFFRFNPLKWNKEIEPLRYQESQQQYLADLENIALSTVDFFFNLMIAQINLNIAKTNLINTDTIYQITQEKFALGKASRNDVLQLKLETLKAKKGLATAEQDVAAASQRLSSFVGIRTVNQAELSLPDQVPDLVIDLDRALKEALTNLPDAIGFTRRKTEAARDIAFAKGNNGFTATLTGSFGLSGRGNTFTDVYRSPQDKEGLFLELSIPIMDWGRSKSQMETARANQQLVQFEVEQDQLNLEQEIITQITLLEMFAQQVTLNAEADQVALDRYQIAQERFIIGNLSITDLSIALQEKDQAKRDYINSLWDFWRSYYTIRYLTLYDFEKNHKIKY